MMIGLLSEEKNEEDEDEDEDEDAAAAAAAGPWYENGLVCMMNWASRGNFRNE